jgi:hypothetical protein
MCQTVECRIGDVRHCGRVITVEQAVDPMALAREVRTAGTDPTERLAVEAPGPPPVYEHVGCLRPDMGLRTRTALASAARSRGYETTYDEQIEALQADLAEVDVASTSTAEQRRVAATTTTETARLREEVAAARGRLQARREADLDPGSAAEDLSAAITRLSEARTSHAAARESLDRARRAARERREQRKRRFRLEDRLANLERQARAALVKELQDEFVATVEAVPGGSVEGSGFDTDPVTAALAIARLAECQAPIVLACDRFADPVTASDWLQSPVIRI